MQIPIIQKTATVLPARTSVDVRVGQPQRPQHQAIRSVILPSNYRTAMSPPRATDCRVLLNSINVPTQVSFACIISIYILRQKICVDKFIFC